MLGSTASSVAEWEAVVVLRGVGDLDFDGALVTAVGNSDSSGDEGKGGSNDGEELHGEEDEDEGAGGIDGQEAGLAEEDDFDEEEDGDDADTTVRRAEDKGKAKAVEVEDDDDDEGSHELKQYTKDLDDIDDGDDPEDELADGIEGQLTEFSDADLDEEN